MWNALVPGTHLTKSAVDNGNDVVLSVASNAADILPSYMAMAWLSIERLCTSLYVLAGAPHATGQPIERRIRDYSHWFKNFAMAKAKQWKARVIFCDYFYIDVRAQMGRMASAHLEKRTFFLIGAIDMSRVAQIFRKRMQDGQVTEQIAR